MNPLAQRLIETFNAEELLAILEAADIALDDPVMYHEVAEHLDLADSVLEPVGEKLHQFLAETPVEMPTE